MVLKIFRQTNNSDQKEDPFAKLIGEFGRWQIFVFATVSLVKLTSGWVQMAILFLTPNLNYRCINLLNTTEEILNDTCYKDCIEYEYDTSPFENTIISEWDLICERSWLSSFTQTMLQLGILIGSFIFGYMSDRYGRKNTFLVAIFGTIVSGLIIPFSPSYEVFTGLRTLLGITTAGTMVVSFVIIMESVGPNYREIAGCLYQIPFVIGHTSVPLFAYYFRSWNTYTLALGIPPLIYLGYFFTLTESPRWLVSKGRVEEATKIVKRAAIINKLPTEKIEETLTELSNEIRKNSNKSNLNYTALFHKSLLLKTICCCIMWLIVGVTFFGFNQYISQTSPDPFVSVAVAGIIQIPSNIGSIWLIKKLGRRLTTSIFFCLGGIFVIILYFVPKVFAATLTLGSLGVSCGAVVATSIYVYTSELYPTVVRNMGLGVASLSMRVGSMLAPFISNTAVNIPWLPTLIFGGTGLLAGLVCLLLPETKGKKLPDSMEDIKNT